MVLTTTDTVTTTITTTMWVIGGVHNDTTNTRALTKMTVTTGFTDLNVLVLLVTNNAHASGTGVEEQTNLT